MRQTFQYFFDDRAFLQTKNPHRLRMGIMHLGEFWLNGVVLLSDMLLVFSQFALADVGETIVLIVLREVETNLFAEGRDSHGNQHVDEFIAQPTHGEGVNKHNDDGQQVVEEDNESIPGASDQSLLDEDTCEHSTKDTTRAMCGEHIEGIIDAAA